MTNFTRSFQNSRFAYLVSAEMVVLAFIGVTAGATLGVIAVKVGFIASVAFIPSLVIAASAGALIAALSLIVYVERQERNPK